MHTYRPIASATPSYRPLPDITMASAATPRTSPPLKTQGSKRSRYGPPGSYQI
ncbi:hypothetical protein BGX38DRAFT_374128 [Terfezia claveryi]|nr:hypothetical protein BGX38DRAFT_374128 [Terfezia claveryi]